MMDDAKTNSTLIDFVYYYSASNYATLAAPDDGEAASFYSGGNGLATWTSRNSTRFKVTSLTADDFDRVYDDIPIITNSVGASATSLHHLGIGNVLAFVTDADKPEVQKWV